LKWGVLDVVIMMVGRHNKYF